MKIPAPFGSCPPLNSRAVWGMYQIWSSNLECDYDPATTLYRLNPFQTLLGREKRTKNTPWILRKKWYPWIKSLGITFFKKTAWHKEIPTDQELISIKYEISHVIFLKYTRKEADEMEINQWTDSKGNIDGRGREQRVSDHCGERLVWGREGSISCMLDTLEKRAGKTFLINRKMKIHFSLTVHRKSTLNDQGLQCKRPNF